METIKIYGTEIGVKEYKGQRVVTFKDIDAVHRRPEGTAGRNFRKNRAHLIENVDYFLVKPGDIQTDEIRPSEINGIRNDEIRTDKVNNRGTIFVTESGYLMLVKSLTDDLAWRVQRELVNVYFSVRSVNDPKFCGTSCSKEIINKWKRTVSNPLVDRINKLLNTSDLVRGYVYLYQQMRSEYGFDMNEEKAAYSQKYNIPLRECVVIDAIAANEELRLAFQQCACDSIRKLSDERVIDEELRAKNRIAAAKDFALESDALIDKVKNAAWELFDGNEPNVLV